MPIDLLLDETAAGPGSNPSRDIDVPRSSPHTTPAPSSAFDGSERQPHRVFPDHTDLSVWLSSVLMRGWGRGSFRTMSASFPSLLCPPADASCHSLCAIPGFFRTFGRTKWPCGRTPTVNRGTISLALFTRVVDRAGSPDSCFYSSHTFLGGPCRIYFCTISVEWL
jgi:hypothetical protein